MDKLAISLAAAVLACLLLVSSAHPSKGSSSSEEKGRKREFIHSTCLVKNGTETVYEAACGDPNLQCVEMKHRRPKATETLKRHAFLRDLDISICMCNNCTSDADCADGVICNTTCGMCAVEKERMAYASACERNGEQVKECPFYKHCASMCARNVTFKGEEYLLSQCHLNKEKGSSSSSSSSSSSEGSSSSSSEEGGSSSSGGSSSHVEDAAEEVDYEQVDETNSLLDQVERELFSLFE